jgi:hypothetical protein
MKDSTFEQVVGSQQAATKIQTAARGLLDRAFAARVAEQEQLFLGMIRQVGLCSQEVGVCLAIPPQTDLCGAVSTPSHRSTPQCVQRGADAALIAKREGKEAAREKIRLAQEEADAAYEAALVNERAEVALIEGPALRADIQGKVLVQIITLFWSKASNPHGVLHRSDSNGAKYRPERLSTMRMAGSRELLRKIQEDPDHAVFLRRSMSGC